ncbi:hypothetical protein [Saccharopolyspora elongata]|uniref:hypothetical protein n=1 Tax=Saccharopolyspora elongata TaxID=2530387 RepID=UPI00140484B9|nr:hypothetical protein [Saccharopolyspora elongata]
MTLSEPTLESALTLGLKPVGVASVPPAGRRTPPGREERGREGRVQVVLDEVVRALRG